MEFILLLVQISAGLLACAVAWFLIMLMIYIIQDISKTKKGDN